MIPYMKCPHCGVAIPSNSVFCPSCKAQLTNTPMPASSMPTCPSCGSSVTPGQNFCVNCGIRLAPNNAPMPAQMAMQQAQLRMQAASLQMQQEQMKIQQQQLDSMLRCPKCGSTSITGQKKGYGAVKGGLGALALGSLAGPVGVVAGLGAGNIGRKKIQCTCLNCGHKFKPGRK